MNEPGIVGAAVRRMPERRTAPRSGPLSWEIDGRDWPNHAASRFVKAAGMTWHVQVTGSGPVLLALHGTGAATHSWRGLTPLLAEHFTVVAPDLPGHGFTGPAPTRMRSLPGIADGVAELLKALDLRPALAVGHSAGAAILARMCLSGAIAPAGLVSLNGALMSFRGFAGQVFAPLAKLLALSPFAPRLVSWGASDPTSVSRMIEGTGSVVDAEGLALYGRLLRSPDHVAGALAMMANWDLASLERDLAGLKTPLELVAAVNDRAVSPEQAIGLRRIVPGAVVTRLPGLGHLAHEERPRLVADLLIATATRLGVLPPGPAPSDDALGG